MKWLHKITSALGLATSLVAPALAQTPVTLDVLYCYPSFARFHEPLAAEFMKKNPHIKFEFMAVAMDHQHRYIRLSGHGQQRLAHTAPKA